MNFFLRFFPVKLKGQSNRKQLELKGLPATSPPLPVGSQLVRALPWFLLSRFLAFLLSCLFAYLLVAGCWLLVVGC